VGPLQPACFVIVVIDGGNNINEGCTGVGGNEEYISSNSSLRQGVSEPKEEDFHPVIATRQIGYKGASESEFCSICDTNGCSEQSSASGPVKSEPPMLFSLPSIVNASATAAALAGAGAVCVCKGV
jgi:hypothetical protein